MSKYRNLALVDQALPEMVHSGYTAEEATSAHSRWQQDRAKLLLALELIEQHGFTVAFKATPSEPLDAFIEREAMRLVAEINPHILADDAVRRTVIAEGYDYCRKYDDILSPALYDEEIAKIWTMRNGALIRAFYKMQHYLNQVRGE